MTDRKGIVTFRTSECGRYCDNKCPAMADEMGACPLSDRLDWDNSGTPNEHGDRPWIRDPACLRAEQAHVALVAERDAALSRVSDVLIGCDRHVYEVAEQRDEHLHRYFALVDALGVKREFVAWEKQQALALAEVGRMKAALSDAQIALGRAEGRAEEMRALVERAMVRELRELLDRAVGLVEQGSDCEALGAAQIDLLAKRRWLADARRALEVK